MFFNLTDISVYRLVNLMRFFATKSSCPTISILAPKMQLFFNDLQISFLLPVQHFFLELYTLLHNFVCKNNQINYMKRAIFFIVFFCFCSGAILLANNTPIILGPTTPPNPYPRAPAKNRTTLIATSDGEELTILFSALVGPATITLTNKSTGIVYQTTINTDTALDFSVPIGGLDSGNYTVTVQYADVTLSGDFEL